MQRRLSTRSSPRAKDAAALSARRGAPIGLARGTRTRKARAAARAQSPQSLDPFFPQSLLPDIYRRLFRAYGPQRWWPGDGPTEIIIGAILTQNTNWKNVEKAIENLRKAGMLDFEALRGVKPDVLAEWIRPAGYFNVKARRLLNFVDWLWAQHGGSLDRLKKTPLPRLRDELLAINGIGPETADSILLYALDRPTFVIDAYTKRISRRHHLTCGEADYDSLKALFEGGLPRSRRLYNEYHALIVNVAKLHCRTKARCAGCPLEGLPHDER